MKAEAGALGAISPASGGYKIFPIVVIQEVLVPLAMCFKPLRIPIQTGGQKVAKSCW